MTEDAEKMFWNADETVAYFESKPPDPRIVGFIDSHYPNTAAMRALDLGCGGGRHSELLASRGFEVSSIDVNPAMIAMTTARLGRAGLAAGVSYGSIISVPYPDVTFDVIVTTGVLHQAKDKNEYEAAIGELARVLKFGGYVLLNIFTDGIWDETYVRSEIDTAAVVTREGLPMTLLSSSYFNNRMQAHDFNLVEDYGEDIKQENTGPRAVYRAHYQRVERLPLSKTRNQDE